MALEPTVVSAVLSGSLAALASVGLTLTYLTTKVPNFAHGSFLTIGAYISVYAVQLNRQNPYIYAWLAFVVAGIVAVAQYRLVLRPLISRGTPIVGQMVATVTVSIFIFGIISIIADWANRVYKVQTSFVFIRHADFVFEEIPGVMISSIALLAAVSLGLYVALHKTRFGTAMRAAIENPSLAGVVGINVNTVYTLSWFLSGGFGGLAGLLFALWFPVTTTSGDEFLPTIFASSVLGGLGSIFGAFAGGLVVGVSSVSLPFALASFGLVEIIQFRPIIPLVIMVIILLTMPEGLTSINMRNILRRWRRSP